MADDELLLVLVNRNYFAFERITFSGPTALVGKDYEREKSKNYEVSAMAERNH